MNRFALATLGLLVCLAPVQGQTAEEKKATIDYLRSLQTGSGGFYEAKPNPLSGAKHPVTLRATSSGLRALKYFGGEVPDKKAAAKFVESCFDAKTGGFVNMQPSLKPDVIVTAVGLMAVVELKMPAEKYTEKAVQYLGENAKTFEEIRLAAAGLEAVGKKVPQAEDWLKEIAKMRNPDGTYGKGNGVGRMTGSAVVAVLRLGGKVDQRDNVVKALKTAQRKDGGFGKEEVAGSDLETTYRVVRCFHMLKEKLADAAACRAFVAKCRNADGGYGVAPGQPSNVGATYFASIILHWLKKE
jgi:prenyltransferase beta subunit